MIKNLIRSSSVIFGNLQKGFRKLSWGNHQNYHISICLYNKQNNQGSYGSWKIWKFLEFYSGIFQVWKVLEKDYWSWKVLEIC